MINKTLENDEFCYTHYSIFGLNWVVHFHRNHIIKKLEDLIYDTCYPSKSEISILQEYFEITRD
jgi:hypothetical protein